MIRMLVERLALTLVVALLVVALLEQFNPRGPELVVEARSSLLAAEPVDYPMCRMITPPPLIAPRERYQLVPGERPKDGGLA